MNKKKEIENLRKENGLLIKENADLQKKVDLFIHEKNSLIEEILKSLKPGNRLVMSNPVITYMNDPWQLGTPFRNAQVYTVVKVFDKSFFVKDENGKESLILFMNIRNGRIEIFEVLPPEEEIPVVRCPSLGLPRIPFEIEIVPGIDGPLTGPTGDQGPSGRKPLEWETTITISSTDNDFKWMNINETKS